MSSSVINISNLDLALSFIPALLAIGLYHYWQLRAGEVWYAFFRMLVQLMLVGYVLMWLFTSNSALIVLIVLLIMIIISSWIALRTVEQIRAKLFSHAIVSILFGSGSTLILVTQAILDLSSWYQPQYVIPLAGMIFSQSMTAISLAAERLSSEMDAGKSFGHARAIAFNTALIPITNSLFAVGLVALPGMMTGQILSGVSPLLASRYQIMVMCMLFGASGLSVACFISLTKNTWLGHSNTATT